MSQTEGEAPGAGAYTTPTQPTAPTRHRRGADSVSIHHASGRMLDVYGHPADLLQRHDDGAFTLERTSLHRLRSLAANPDPDAALGPYRAYLPPQPDAPVAPGGQGVG